MTFPKFGISLLTMVALATTAMPHGAAAKPKPKLSEVKKAKKPKPDLANMLEGSWTGDVTSDASGSSKSDVTLTIRRTGQNTITISSDYRRLPVVVVQLERAMNSIVAARGDTTVVYDAAKNPPMLDVVFNGEVAWAGYRDD